MQYPATLLCEDDGCTVTFPDIPEAITSGSNRDEALRHAADALESALDFYFDGNRYIPPPSALKRGQHLVEVEPSLAAKALLHNELITQHVRPSELARRMKLNRQDVNRLLNPRHATKINTVAAAFHALGRSLEVNIGSPPVAGTTKNRAGVRRRAVP